MVKLGTKKLQRSGPDSDRSCPGGGIFLGTQSRTIFGTLLPGNRRERRK